LTALKAGLEDEEDRVALATGGGILVSGVFEILWHGQTQTQTVKMSCIIISHSNSNSVTVSLFAHIHQ
jgi:hypothetical protein